MSIMPLLRPPNFRPLKFFMEEPRVWTRKQGTRWRICEKRMLRLITSKGLATHVEAHINFRDAKCHGCHRIGHIEKVCRSQNSVKMVIPEARSEEDINVFTAQTNHTHIYHQIFFENGKSRQFILDTGSPISFMPRKEIQAIGFKASDKRNTSTTIRGISGHQHPVHGEVTALIRGKFQPQFH